MGELKARSGAGFSMGDETTSVRVAVRVRPQTGLERACGHRDCVVCHSSTRQAVMGDKSFTFDYVYDQTSTQEAIYSQCVRPLMEASLSGYNSTVLAYGQTGSGKTYTMGSSSWSALSDKELGVLPRAFRQIFDAKNAREAAGGGSQMVLKASFVEIHNEELRDLVAASGSGMGSKRSLQIREDQSGSIYVAGAEECEVASFGDLLACLEQGSSRRATGSTEMNTHSSRSHAIFSVTLEQHSVIGGEGGEGGASDEGAAGGGGDVEYITSKFHFVDLAGSERIKKTKAEGDRLREGISINGGLLALGNVISALGDEEKLKGGRLPVHVPYRDSKLTRMLQDSLGGNSRTLMIACISPADSNFEESLSTLKYANRARNIKNTPVINRDPNSHLIAQLRKEVGWLRHFMKESGISLSHVTGYPGTPSFSLSPNNVRDSGNGQGRGGGDGKARYLGSGEEGASESSVAGAAGAGGERERQLETEVEMLKGERSRLEGEVGERVEQLDLVKRALAEIYLTNGQLAGEFDRLVGMISGKNGGVEDAGIGASVQEIHRGLRCISVVEEACRLRTVLKGLPGAMASPLQRPGVVSSTGGGVLTPLDGGGPAGVLVPALNMSFGSPSVVGGTTPESAKASHRGVGDADQSFDGLDSSRMSLWGGGGGGDETNRSALGEGAEGLVGQIRLQGQLNDIDTTLLEKERLLSELVKNQRDFDKMKISYERKMGHLLKDIRQIEDERDKILGELTVLDRKAQEMESMQSREDREKSRAESERFKERLRVLEEELKRMRKKMKDHQKLVSFKEHGEVKIQQLSTEVSRLKDNRIELHQKMARDQRGHREKQGALQKEITSLKRAEIQGKKAIAELEMRLSATARAEHVSRRRAQIAAHKSESGGDSSGVSASSRKKSVPTTDVLAWFEQAVQRSVGRREAAEQVKKSELLRAQLEGELKACKAKLVSGKKDGAERQGLADEVEYLEAELEFRKIELGKAVEAVRDGEQAASDMEERVSTLPESDVRRLIPVCFNQIIASRRNADSKGQEVHEVSVKYVETQRKLEEARMEAQAKMTEVTSKMTAVEREYEGKLLFLVKQLEEARGATPRGDRSTPRTSNTTTSSSSSSNNNNNINNNNTSSSNMNSAGGGGGSNVSSSSNSHSHGQGHGQSQQGGHGRSGGKSRGRGEGSRSPEMVWGGGREGRREEEEGGRERVVGGGGGGGGGSGGRFEDDMRELLSECPEVRAGLVDNVVTDSIWQELRTVWYSHAPVDQRRSGPHGVKRSESQRVARMDRRSRVDELAMKVNSLWEANQVPDMHRSKFRSVTQAMSSKPEMSFQAYEAEYREQARMLSGKIEAELGRIESSWEEMETGQEARARFVSEMEALKQRGDDLGTLRLARDKCVSLEGSVKVRREITSMMQRRSDMLRTLCDDVDQCIPTKPSDHKGKQERIRGIIKEYPKLIARIKRYAARWEEAEGTLLRVGGSSVVDSVTNGDAHDSLLRAMHVKLMGSSGLKSGASSSESTPSREAEHATRRASLPSPSPDDDEHHARHSSTEVSFASPDDSRSKNGGHISRSGEKLVRSSRSEAHLTRSRDTTPLSAGKQSSPSTSAIAARFEALKKTYAQVRSRSTAGSSGREAAVRSALQEKGLLPSPRDPLMQSQHSRKSTEELAFNVRSPSKRPSGGGYADHTRFQPLGESSQSVDMEPFQRRPSSVPLS